MRRVAARRLMDLGRYDPLDWASRLRLAMALNTAGNDAELEGWQQVQTLHLGLATMAAAAWPNLNEVRQKALEVVFQAHTHISKLLSPWLHQKDDGQEKQEQANAITQLRQAWINEWGDPKDPAVAAAIQRTADWLHRTSRPRNTRR